MQLMLKEYRKDAKMTQKDVAAEIGCSYRSIQSWEGGLTFPDADDLAKLCALFNCTPNDMLGWYADHPQAPAPSDAERRLSANYLSMDATGRDALLAVSEVMAGEGAKASPPREGLAVSGAA